MATKQIALGTILKTDAAVAMTFAAQTLVREITPPPRAREEIDGMDLGDTLDVPLLGIEQRSRSVYKQFWEPGDTTHETIDTEFDNKTEFAVQIVTPHATPVTDEFDCKCVGLTPSTLTTGGVFEREVTLVRTSAITRT